jgi:hypothetical protein
MFNFFTPSASKIFIRRGKMSVSPMAASKARDARKKRESREKILTKNPIFSEQMPRGNCLFQGFCAEILNMDFRAF